MGSVDTPNQEKRTFYYFKAAPSSSFFCNFVNPVRCSESDILCRKSVPLFTVLLRILWNHGNFINVPSCNFRLRKVRGHVILVMVSPAGRFFHIIIKNPDLHTAPKGSIVKSLQYGSDESEKSKQIEETNAMG